MFKYMPLSASVPKVNFVGEQKFVSGVLIHPDSDCPC